MRNYIYLIAATVLAITSATLGVISWILSFESLRLLAPLVVGAIVLGKIAAVFSVTEPFVFAYPPNPYDASKGGWDTKKYNDYEEQSRLAYQSAKDRHSTRMQTRRPIAVVFIVLLIAVMMLLEATALSHYYYQGKRSTQAQISNNSIVEQIADKDEQIRLIQEFVASLPASWQVRKYEEEIKLQTLLDARANLRTKLLSTQLEASLGRGAFESVARLLAVDESVFARIFVLGIALSLDALYLWLFTLVRVEKTDANQPI